MQITFVTLFPEILEKATSYSIIKNAIKSKLVKLDFVNIRKFAIDKYQTVDDRPYGGGTGMILKVDVIDRAITGVLKKNKFSRKLTRIILLDPQGITFNQKIAVKLTKFSHLILIAGHYEGVDERIRKLVDMEISIGDFVLTGGEIPSLAIADSIIRLIPGVLKKSATDNESFNLNLLEHPQYTRPEIYKKMKVPEILLSGHHQKIKSWQIKQSLKRTQQKRPDLINKSS